MGTDIHCHLERRTAADQPWQHVPDAAVVDDRNYNLFAMMASVRNGHGFAGIKTGEGFVPISEPRGLPEDCSPQVRADSDGWDADGHSHSWLTIADIMAYDWSQTTTLTGVVDLPNLARWKLLGQPESWSGLISGPDISIISGDQGVGIVEEAIAELQMGWWDVYHLRADSPIAGGSEPVRHLVASKSGIARPYFQVSWQRAYHEVAGELLSRVVPLSWSHGSPENVRLVFWFDN